MSYMIFITIRFVQFSLQKHIARTTTAATIKRSFGTVDSNPPQIPFLDVGASYRELKEEYENAYHRVMGSGQYILGEEVEAFEVAWAAACGVEHCVGVGSGLDALFLILRAYGIGPGDEVIVPSNTFIATWLSVSHTGARPVPVEPDPKTFNIDTDRIEAAINVGTRAIVPVHLYGQPAQMDEILEIASRHGLLVIEDAAQAHGAEWRGNRVGGLADAAAFSFYPVKNLGAFGDGGAVMSNDLELVERIRVLRNYGCPNKYMNETRGYNSRLDPLQAAFLHVRLKYLNEWNVRRSKVAGAYREGLAGIEQCILPTVSSGAKSAWHLFVIRHTERDGLREHLRRLGVATGIHYPVPPHLTPSYANQGYRRGDLPVTEKLADTVLSLPMGPHLGERAVNWVIEAVRSYSRG